jgi:hypothetical protein
MKIVLDTNIVVSGLLQSQGNPAHLFITTVTLADAIAAGCNGETTFTQPPATGITGAT